MTWEDPRRMKTILISEKVRESHPGNITENYNLVAQQICHALNGFTNLIYFSGKSLFYSFNLLIYSFNDLTKIIVSLSNLYMCIINNCIFVF